MLLLLLACKTPAVAPTELSALGRFLFREFEAEDPALLAEGAENLRPWFEDVPDAGYILEGLDEDDVAGLTRPDRDPALAQSVAVLYASQWPVEDHARVIVLEDLVEVSPSAEVYSRAFIEGEPDCFEAGGCEWLRSINEISRSNLFVSLAFTLRKDWRWLTLPDGRPGLISRGWIEEEAYGESGNNNLLQSYEIEAWLPSEGGALRLFTIWSEGDYSGMSEDMMRSAARIGMEDSLEEADDWLAENP